MNGTVAENSPPGRRILWTRLIVIALVIGVIAILGLSRLADPFTGDQALFLQGARAMARGAVLYREFWDIKPPGIFLFYYVAGRLFGFSEMGVHSFELLWMILFAAILMSAVSKSFGNRIACLTALFTICPYYLLGSFWDLTQPEAIVALPMFVVLAALQNTCATNRHRPLWLLLAGCASGIVFLFKPVLFLVPLSVCIFSLDAERKSGGRLWHRCTFLLIGALLPFLVTTAFFVAKGGALCFLDTLLVIPLQLARSTNARSRLWLLRVFSEWFIRDHAFLLLFAAVAVLQSAVYVACRGWPAAPRFRHATTHGDGRLVPE